jgi:hypothetical protein
MNLTTEPPLQLAMSPGDWIPVALDLYQGLRQLAGHFSRDGLYEMLEYDSILEFLDPQGEWAAFKKRLRVKF